MSSSSSCDTGALFDGVRGYNPSELETAEASSRSGSRMDEPGGYHAEAFISSARTLRRNGTNPQRPRSIGTPVLALGLGNTIATGLRLRTCRFATVKAARRVARLRSDPGSRRRPAPQRGRLLRRLGDVCSDVKVMPRFFQ